MFQALKYIKHTVEKGSQTCKAMHNYLVSYTSQAYAKNLIKLNDVIDHYAFTITTSQVIQMYRRVSRPLKFPTDQ